jgi:hypothetical protein
MARRYRCLGPGYLWIRFGSVYDGFTGNWGFTASLQNPDGR